MKKFWVKNNFLFLAITPTFFLMACNSTISQEQANQSLVSAKYDSFRTQFSMHKLLGNYLSNKEQISDYLLNQNNLPQSKISQLKYSLTWFNLFRNFRGHNDSDKATRTESSAFIFNTLTKDWYWYLANITKMTFVYNPYNRNFAEYKGEEKDFEKNFARITKSLESNLISRIIEIPLENQLEDIYKQKSALYLKYNDDFYIKIYKLVDEKDKINFIIWPDLYKVESHKSPEDILGEFENKIMAKRLEEIQKDIAHFTKRPYRGYTEAKSYAYLNDTNLFEYALYGLYYNFSIEAINEINQQSENQITRYTLRGADEN